MEIDQQQNGELIPDNLSAGSEHSSSYTSVS